MPYADTSKAKAYRKRYYQEHRAKACADSRTYYDANRELVAAKARTRYLNKRDFLLRQMAEYRSRNWGRIRESKAQWYRREENRLRIQEKFRERYSLDAHFHIASVLRGRIRRAVKSQAAVKAHLSTELLGCSVTEVRNHLQRQFKRGMTWVNFGTKWHIDHIIPCSAFDLREPRQQRQCFHYTNLRPLWARANIRKSNRVTHPQLSLLI